MEDRGSPQWWHPGQSIIQKALEAWRQRMVLDDGLRLIGWALRPTIAISNTDGKCAGRDQHNRRAPALVTRSSRFG